MNSKGYARQVLSAKGSLPPIQGFKFSRTCFSDFHIRSFTVDKFRSDEAKVGALSDFKKRDNVWVIESFLLDWNSRHDHRLMIVRSATSFLLTLT